MTATMAPTAAAPSRTHPFQEGSNVTTRIAGAALLALLALALSAAAETVAEADTLVVTGDRPVVGADALAPDVDLAASLARSPFALIRKGASACADLYADGFKRGDIVFTIDGERHTTACPNRMDTRVGQVDLSEVARVELDRTAGGLQSGLGGRLAFTRRPPSVEGRVTGRMDWAGGDSDELDAGLTVEGGSNRVAARWRRLGPWTDADGGTFVDRYGFAETPDGEVLEVRADRAWDGGDAALGWETSTDLLFPYLLMDERENDHLRASVSVKGHRVYVNRNEHLMDNGLRASFAMTDMVTDATNTMAGVTGDHWELYVRNWDAENRITPQAAPAMAIDNHMLPDVTRVFAQARRSLGVGPVDVDLRLGAARTSVGDGSVASMYEAIHAGASTERWSVPFGVTASRRIDVGEASVLSFGGEVASDPPSIEQMFIAVDKPGTKPTWLGNPELSDPVRATARVGLVGERVRVEAFATRVTDYPYLARVMGDGGAYQTYKGVDAVLAGAHLAVEGEFVSTSLAWNRGGKVDDGPLAEVRPLMLTVAARTPESNGIRGRMLFQHASAQDRVDDALGETPTAAWDRLDLGADWERDGLRVALTVENVTDEAYARHLSYLRNPFSAGIPVTEPGRTVRLSASFTR